MKKLNISITKAQLVSFSVELKEGKPEVTATIALLTDGGKQVTTYSIGTDSWRSDTKFDLPVEIMPLIGDVARVLEAVAVRQCQDGQLALPAPGFPVKKKVSQPAIIDAGDNEPINLDEIPF